MSIPILYGVRTFGKVFACGSTALATQFFHVWYLPVLPVGGVLMLSHGARLPARLRLDSVLAGYARTWGIVAAAGLLGWRLLGSGGGRGPATALAVAALVAAAAAWAYGRLSREAMAQQSSTPSSSITRSTWPGCPRTNAQGSSRRSRSRSRASRRTRNRPAPARASSSGRCGLRANESRRRTRAQGG